MTRDEVWKENAWTDVKRQGVDVLEKLAEKFNEDTLTQTTGVTHQELVKEAALEWAVGSLVTVAFDYFTAPQRTVCRWEC